MASPNIRRTPVQERSSGTVQQIFQATSALLGKMPLEEITTSRIAAEADVSVGGLYRFFPDKQSIIDAIAVRHMENFQAHLEQRLGEENAPASGPDFLNMVIDEYVDFLDAHPDFRTIALGRHVSPQTRQRQLMEDAGPVGLVRRVLLARLGAESSLLDLGMRIASEAGERLIAYAFAQPSKVERTKVINEMKRLLASYLFR